MPQPETQSAKQVFLSYSRTDRDASIALRLALEQAGLSVFQDEDAIRSGDRWVTKLEQALENCCAFVVLVGQDGIQRWVGAEVQVALIRHLSPHDDAGRLPIFPVLLGDAKAESMPPFLALFQADHWKPAEPLAGSLVEAIKTHAIRTNSQVVFEGCPFLGLSAFAREDARLFFGRRRETLEALTYLGDQQQSNPEQLHHTGGPAYTRWLQIEGNSGSGKSSLVQAGMLPMIEQGALWARTGFEHWRILGPMMPGKNPLEKLAETLEQGLVDDPAKRDSLGRLERLNKDPRALAFTIKDFRQTSTAFLLIVDQFEELFTFADEAGRKQFDALLTAALYDPECPLFLINTVRADFLDRFEYLPGLQSIYNSHCKRYFLPIMSASGLREIIEQPARLAGLDVSEITTAILNDARDETGALPLVENALLLLWQQRRNHKLSGDVYRQQDGIAGMLSQQADALLDRIEQAAPKKGKQAALELLLALTRVNDEGRNTRKRIAREDAIYAAGKGDGKLGEQVLRMLSGERWMEALSTGHHDSLRLITISEEKNPQGEKQQFADLIHETLVRARPRTASTQKPEGYWPTLYRYLEQNPDREILRQQLNFSTKQWQGSNFLEKIGKLCYSYFDLKNYRKLGIRAKTLEDRFLTWSKRAQIGLAFCAFAVTIFIGDNIYWAMKPENVDVNMPLEIKLWNPLYQLGYKPSSELVTIPIIKEGKFLFGDEDGEKSQLSISKPFQLGRYEVTYQQFDYYVWSKLREPKDQNNLKEPNDEGERCREEMRYPDPAPGGRGSQPVVNINWCQANNYAKWLGKQKNLDCRLPTEIEWEYAARAGTDSRYHWGGALRPVINGKETAMANCNGCGSQWDNKRAAPVGKFLPNQFGLYDMSGNVWEWTCSNYEDIASESNAQLCPGKISDEARVLRGGSWDDSPDFVRSSARNDGLPGSRGGSIGFRVLCSSPIE
jgi:formylglycine-generating enzyme required for sulfatase activity